VLDVAGVIVAMTMIAIKPGAGFHSLRHTWGSALMESGADVTEVSRQMGHSKILVTLDVYRHEWSAARHADRTREIAEEQFGGLP
jgi:integrase